MVRDSSDFSSVSSELHSISRGESHLLYRVNRVDVMTHLV